MRGAGIEYKKKKYITHTTLPFAFSAAQTFTLSQRIILGFAGLSALLGLIFFPLFTIQAFVAVISVLYFIDTVFNFVLTMRSLHKPNEIYSSEEELLKLSDKDLPMYTILCPLYKEAHVIPQFVEAIAKLDYPKDKLDVMLLLEQDDEESIASVERMHLPFYFRTIVVPDSKPKTKPKACNYGLTFAKGEYLVIFDAEDIPDPLQLKKAFLGFQKVPAHIVCLQAKLNYYNARQNILTRFFTAEYSLWFDLTLTGLQSFNSTIPLGGTSNHFKTKILLDLQGWDPFNVTEDADLGIRLFKKGYQTAIIDSTTYEEATSKMKNWIRQRSRWIKGYMQTYLVHMRTSGSFLKEKGLFHNFIFQLTVGGKLLFLLLNPLMWIITIGYFAAYPFFGPTVEAIYQPPISYIAVFSWIFGNFLFLYYYMLGCGKRNQWDLMKYVFLVPFYWGMMSVAGGMALYQLIFKPHYWEKTLHGFHLLNEEQKKAAVSRSAVAPKSVPAYATILTRAFSQKGFVNKISYIPSLVFSRKDFTLSFLQILSVSVLLTFDFIWARFFLSPENASIYFLLSLTCKIIAIIAQGIAHIANELFSKHKKSIDRFYDLVFSVFVTQWVAFVVFGLEGYLTIPYLFGERFDSILPYIPFFLFGCMCFAIANIFGRYHAKGKNYLFTFVSLFIVFFQVYFFFTYHGSIKELATVVAYLGTINIMAMILLHVNKNVVGIIENNFTSLLSMWKSSSAEKAWHEKRMRILVFNWRDTKHVYAGGAEVYIHELAKRWVKDGNKVTMFCGNDNRRESNEHIDGVDIIRRGGTYTVYIFAFLYYLLKFRGKYDVVVDCENGIPFFSPFFTSKPVILLIHHVHQEVFRDFLSFPWKQIAAFLEAKVMPFVYRNKIIVTVSESSKKEILGLGFAKEEKIEVIYNGVDSNFLPNMPKSLKPSFVYLGRLRKYKNIDIAIKAFASVVRSHPTAKLSIVGSGEHDSFLKKLVANLGIENSVTFLGRVSEEEKAILLGQSWAMLQPSQVEGWGITVIEANAAGTPVIASRVNGLKDSVVDEKTGILVPVKDVVQFAEAMNKIIESAPYRTMLSQNAFVWSKNFDWDKSAKAFYKLFGKSLDVQSRASSYESLRFVPVKDSA